MSFYNNDKCPVCGEQFKDGDDIVTCPYCGTPHHRECYNKNKACANADKHGTDFVYKSAGNPEESKKPEVKKVPIGNFYIPNDAIPEELKKSLEDKNTEENDTAKCSKCGATFKKGTPFCPSCGEKQDESTFSDFKPPVSTFTPRSDNYYASSDDKIDDVKIADAETVVRANAKKFIPKFIKNKKVSWNWSAFFFGPLYLFFRKMYKEGALFMVLNYILQLVVQAKFYDSISAVSKAVQSLSGADSNNYMTIANEIVKMPEYANASKAMAIIFAGMAVVHIIIALFADTFYRSKVISTVKSVDEQLKAGSTFRINPFFVDGNADLSQKEMRKMFLIRQGGTSLFAPIIAYLVLDLISTIISYL